MKIFTFTSAETLRTLAAIDLTKVAALKVIGEHNLRVIFDSGVIEEFTLPTASQSSA